MVKRLGPDSDRFHLSHPAWVEQTSMLIEASEPGTVFGLFGGWGIGKSSAALTVSKHLMRNGENFALRVQAPALVISRKGFEEFVEAPKRNYLTSTPMLIAQPTRSLQS